jgi:hypothetical protein
VEEEIEKTADGMINYFINYCRTYFTIKVADKFHLASVFI